jgi:adenylosuccinate synthase
MPVSVIVGGQYGSEGKGKVAHFFAKKYNASAVVRVGGPNSGHTVIDDNGNALIFKHLPTASIIKGTKCILTAGNYINISTLLSEIELSNIQHSDLLIDPYAVIITNEDIEEEKNGNLVESIGSTGCGLGAAVTRRISRNKDVLFAKDAQELKNYIEPTNEFLRSCLDKKERVIVEGTQGFGLSLLHSNLHPFCTSRDTTASGFLSEAGISPIDVDDVIMVIRAFPIRVAGNSGPLSYETTWEKISENMSLGKEIKEFTSVTKKVRRVADFDPVIVRRAISYNNPTQIILNHVDYVEGFYSDRCRFIMQNFVTEIESQIRRTINYVGIDKSSLYDRSEVDLISSANKLTHV